MVVFEVKGQKTEETVKKLYEKKIIGSATPYAITYSRLACGIMNTPEEVDKTLKVVHAIAV